MNKKAVNANYLKRNSLRNFSEEIFELENDFPIETRTSTARLAVERAKKIVSRNLELAEELKDKDLNMKFPNFSDLIQ